jgi:NAD(P)-dependent dehydrogenase (short-subunit alcohol dehydrogenase family)
MSSPTTNSSTSPPKKLTWLITGCSSPSGFGLTLAHLALSAGHTVIASSRNPSHTPSLTADFERKGGKWITLDVTSPLTPQTLSTSLPAGISLSSIDILVNNAGYCSFSPIETAKEEEVRDMMETMYFGPLRLIQAVLPGMRERRFGTVVNFSSGAALDGNPTMGAYAGAKGGMDGMFFLSIFFCNWWKG